MSILENKVKKNIAIFICCLLILTCSLCGCATFSVNRAKYYNEVVAKVGDENITRFELLTAHNSYSQQGYSTSMSDTLDSLIDREVLYQSAKASGKYEPTAYQVNNAINDMFESVDSQMDNYISTAKAKLKIKSNETDSTSDEQNLHPISDYAYKKRATLANGKIQYIVESEPSEFDELIERKYLDDYTLSGTVQAIVDKYLARLDDQLKDIEKKNEVKKEALSLMTHDLIDYEFYLRDENGKRYNTVSSDLIYRYFERNFETSMKNLYITNLRTDFLKNEELSISSLEEKYKYLALNSYNKYVHHLSKYKTDMKDIGTKADTILYHPDLDTGAEDGVQFGYFIHVLFNFSEDQKTLIKNLDQAYKDKLIDKAEYDNRYAEIISDTTVKPRDINTGKEEDVEPKKVTDILATEYADVLAISNSDYETKLNKFIELMFKYTGDTATLTAGMPYVVGTNDNSAMEKAFTDEAVRLMNTGINGAMTSANIDESAITSYGLHFLFYVGDVRDSRYYIKNTDRDSAYISETDRDDNGLNLYTKVINPLTGKTYFDMMFDSVYPASGDEVYTSNTGYGDYEKNTIESAKKDSVKVIKYTTRIKATKPTLD